MEVQQICVRCSKKVPNGILHNKMCKRCADVVEFGYPSFPSYKLEDAKNEKVLETAQN